MIRGGTPTIYVSDMDRAVDFYSQTLGLKVTYRAGNEWCGIDAGDGLKLGLHPASERSPTPGANGATILGFGVSKPIDEVVSTLRQKGVTFKGPIIDDAKGSIRLAYFSDPDGNDLYLCESKWKGPGN
jgi:catechol 2,3-dioxygenase-like lactoylglutathione lyase family enzyme